VCFWSHLQYIQSPGIASFCFHKYDIAAFCQHLIIGFVFIQTKFKNSAVRNWMDFFALLSINIWTTHNLSLWLSIFLDNIIVWAPSILHFKGFGMRNLQCEMRICQKSHDKVTKTVYVWFEFLWIRRYNEKSD
jgi:hypothetical protein